MYSLSRTLSTSNGRQTATAEYELIPIGRMGRMAKVKAAAHPITTSTMAGLISSLLFWGEKEGGKEGKKWGEGKCLLSPQCTLNCSLCTHAFDCHATLC